VPQKNSDIRPSKKKVVTESSSRTLLPDEAIVVRGARIHNLKSLSVTIPRDSFTVLTGISGCGKSSLAFDTIYAEGQRRYIESLSAYARQFLEQMTKPDVDSISGLSPTISIEQKTVGFNPRSTVGTVTEIWDYLRLLFSRIGKPFCYQCGDAIQSQTPQQITDQILELKDATKCAILSPIVRGRKGEYQKELLELRSKGFVRVRIDGEVLDLSSEIELDKNKKHFIEVYVDRLIIKGDRGALSTRVSESVDLALKMGGGNLILETYTKDPLDPLKEKVSEQLFSDAYACLKCGISYPHPEPRCFSFNSPMGACEACEGLGVDPKILHSSADDDPENTDEVDDLPKYAVEKTPENFPCPSCGGSRLSPMALHFKIGNRSIGDLSVLSLKELQSFFEKIQLTSREVLISERITKEIKDKIFFLLDVGVGYLSLSRSAKTLSGGESQRIRLATQIGSSLTGVIYVLDEPSIGLHQRDNDKLIRTLKSLRDLGNTVIVVEHDEDTMEAADYLIDIGPGAGIHGGEVVSAGTFSEVKATGTGFTGKYLRKELKIELPKNRRALDPKRKITLQGVSENNLKDINVTFPLGVLTCVSGVSGSGKSSLVFDVLYREAFRHVYAPQMKSGRVKKVIGIEQIDKVIDIDQSPIGRTPRSNPATYTGLFSMIRELFARLPESQIRGFKPGRFSFNVKGGRCEACEGDGMKKIEMHFMPDVYVECDRCKGKRYNRETLDIRYKGKSIDEVLGLSIEEAAGFFETVPYIHQKLKTLNEVGLGYLTLGQSAPTLSGGEAQRMKLAKELSKRSTGKTLYILDEPSTGLHFEDIKKLLFMLQQLVDQGNSVVIIEHNLDIIKCADHVIDLGPEAGSAGGEIVAEGTPESVAANSKSHTGRYLKKVL
jgi:excinuclease ABC subunit A